MNDLVRRYATCRAEIVRNTFTGHAAVFGQYADLGTNLEQLDVHAFDQVLHDPQTDVRALFNHNPDMLLGRQGAGTLKIGTDTQGLAFEIAIPNTTLGNDLRELVGRDDVNGASFAFMPGEAAWSRTEDGRPVQTHTSVARLLDVSPVTFPAYDGASTMLRAMSITIAPAGNRRASQLVRARARVLFGRD
jgi:HK97 family phage prohead protease